MSINLLINKTNLYANLKDKIKWPIAQQEIIYNKLKNITMKQNEL